ncbi:unnamed protein product, partial [Nesidiocoris tenuis]
MQNADSPNATIDSHRAEKRDHVRKGDEAGFSSFQRSTSRQTEGTQQSPSAPLLLSHFISGNDVTRNSVSLCLLLLHSRKSQRPTHATRLSARAETAERERRIGDWSGSGRHGDEKKSVAHERHRREFRLRCSSPCTVRPASIDRWGGIESCTTEQTVYIIQRGRREHSSQRATSGLSPELVIYHFIWNERYGYATKT